MKSDALAERTQLAKSLFKIGALRSGRFTLASGKQSSYYLDLRVVPSYPDVYSRVIKAYEAMTSEIGDRNIDAIAGVATAGVTISSPLALLLKKPMLYVRKEEKGHGLGRQVEGATRPGQKTVVVDDLVTTGGSLISAVEALRKAGCVVREAIVLVDRLEGGSENLAAVGVGLRAYARIADLAETLYRGKMMTKRDYDAVIRQVERRGG